MMVIAMTTPAIIQPAAIHRPPNTIHIRLRSKETGDITRMVLASFKATMAFTLARQLREGLTGFSNMSVPCFSTKALALLASSDSNQGS